MQYSAGVGNNENTLAPSRRGYLRLTLFKQGRQVAREGNDYRRAALPHSSLNSFLCTQGLHSRLNCDPNTIYPSRDTAADIIPPAVPFCTRFSAEMWWDHSN